MAIDVEWQDERGEQIVRYIGPPIDGRLSECAPASSVCLRFIDPYGDTTFNDAQVAVLEQELAAIDTPDDIAVQARSLLAFTRQVQDRTHLLPEVHRRLNGGALGEQPRTATDRPGVEY